MHRAPHVGRCKGLFAFAPKDCFGRKFIPTYLRQCVKGPWWRGFLITGRGKASPAASGLNHCHGPWAWKESCGHNQWAPCPLALVGFAGQRPAPWQSQWGGQWGGISLSPAIGSKVMCAGCFSFSPSLWAQALPPQALGWWPLLPVPAQEPALGPCSLSLPTCDTPLHLPISVGHLPSLGN